MNDWVIRARGLSKVYRLYARPHHRVLDAFGLLGAGRYREHAALDRIDVEIRRGEKVALIGRNGAGKSTFLKLVTQVARPTSGEMEVRGKVQALLQIGTGFHPDFTGRQNINAYLAQLGISGGDAEVKVAEIVEFAELEEYIDQPTKTYSTGMEARLMFATSTAITPDVLVLDEILGVGDAYFAQKSFERMRSLCEAEGTTLLMVTHDIYSALRIADRVLWIDRGRLLMDGEGRKVANAYEDSVRLQEEARLRLKTRRRLETLGRTTRGRDSVIYVPVEMQARGGRPLAASLHVAEIVLLVEGRAVSSLPLGADAFDAAPGSHLDREAGGWGDPHVWRGMPGRPMLHYGSPFHKVSGVLAVPAEVDLALASLRVTYGSDRPCDVQLRCFLHGSDLDLGALPPSEGQLRTHEVALASGAHGKSVLGDPSWTRVQGTGQIVVTNIALVDEGEKETRCLQHGRPAAFVIDYAIADPTLRERAQVLLALHGEGIPTVGRALARDLLFDASRAARGRIRCRLPRMMLGPGTYSTTILITREGYFDGEPTVFYSLNPGVYCAIARVLEFDVTGGGVLARGSVFVTEGEWAFVGTEETPQIETGSARQT
jgi:ABC-type polysaccharide/polyol phosphate transport system ATPase subunit